MADEAKRVLDQASENSGKGPGNHQEGPPDVDAFYAYLSNEYRQHRLIALIFAIVGFLLFFLAVALDQSGVIASNAYAIMMTLANLFIVLMAVVVFTRVRPFKRRMKDYEGKPASGAVDAAALDGVKVETRATRDMDGFYKVLERGIRTELIPDLPEYHQLRRMWIGLYIAAVVIGLAAIALYLAIPGTDIFASIMLIAAFALVIIAFYLDRTRMKPMRVQWARSLGMTEMEARDNMPQ